MKLKIVSKNALQIISTIAIFSGIGVAYSNTASIAAENRRVQAQIAENERNETYREAIQECRNEASQRSGASRQNYWQQCTSAAQKARYRNEIDGLRKE